MASLTPVEHDPFASAEPLRITVNAGKERAPKLTPVDHDPFAPMGVAEDAARSAGAGLIHGTAGIIGTPEAVGSLGAKGIDKLTELSMRGLAALGVPGMEYKKPGLEEPIFSLPTAAGTTKAIEENITGPLHKPQTRAGKFVGKAAEFIPGAVLAPGGVVGNAIRYGVVPGLASEAAGQATEGSQFEQVARVGGALAGAGGAALLSRPGTAARAIREQLPEGVTPQMVDQARGLIDDAAAQGIQLSWPEALSQTAGRPILTNTLRHLEAAPQTEARMAEFFGDRAPSITRAARQEFSNVAPPNQQPSGIGPAVGQAAEGEINRERQFINLATDADYAAAAPRRLSPQEMAPIVASPEWPAARAAVRNDPQLNRHVANLPDDSVGFLNEVKKYIDQQAANARSPVAQNQSVQRAAGLETDAATVRDAATRASPDYAIALHEQARMREQYLVPLLQGPLGKIAGKDTTTKAAMDALFPLNPLPNSAQEIGSTVGALARRNETAARDLVRAHVESTFNQAARDLQPGANQMGGAKFRSVLVGNPQQAANLEAAVRALPHGDQVWPGFNRFLEVLEATGTRQGVGSRTAYNAEILKGQAASGLIGETAKGVANPMRGAQFLADKYERYRLGRNLNELADILTNPAAVGQLRAIARMPVGGTQALNVALRIGALTRTASDPVQQSRQ